MKKYWLFIIMFVFIPLICGIIFIIDFFHGGFLDSFALCAMFGYLFSVELILIAMVLNDKANKD